MLSRLSFTSTHLQSRSVYISTCHRIAIQRDVMLNQNCEFPTYTSKKNPAISLAKFFIIRDQELHSTWWLSAGPDQNSKSAVKVVITFSSLSVVVYGRLWLPPNSNERASPTAIVTLLGTITFRISSSSNTGIFRILISKFQISDITGERSDFTKWSFTAI